MPLPGSEADMEARLGVLRSRRTRSACLIAAVSAVALHDAAIAQTPAHLSTRLDSTSAVTAADTSDLVPLFGWKDAAIGAGFVVATIALFQVDRHVAIQAQDKVTQANQFLSNVTTPAEVLAWPGALAIETGLYAVGRLTNHPRAAEVGWHSAEAILFATATTNVLKKVVGRARPYVSGDPHDFKFLGGFTGHDRSSFPSGHTTTAFAFAASIASESRKKWPDKWWSQWAIPMGVYSGATVVGISRLYHNQHWASDVALGAAIGTFSGIKVIQWAHDHPNNTLDRIMLGTHVVPDASGGMMLTWSRNFR
jgi:membrane-associated phospholipid phosphatase